MAKKSSEDVEAKATKKKAPAAKKAAPAKKTVKKAAPKKTVKKETKAAPKKPAAAPKKPAAKKKPASKKETKTEAPVAEKKKFEAPVEKIKYFEKKEAGVEKKKKPRFRRQELGKIPRIKDKWRAPRGIDSKQAEGKRGKGKTPKIGYKNPDKIRGMHPKGFFPIVVNNTTELSKIKPEVEGAIIAAAVGRKKRNEIIKSANELKITILNPRKGEI